MNRTLRQAWLSFKALYSYLKPVDYLLFMLIHPLLQLIFFSLLVRYAYGTSDITPWVIGNSFLMASGSSVFVLGTLIRSEKFQGTLQYVLLSPANQLGLFLTRGIFHFFDIFLKVVTGFLIGWLFFGLKIEVTMIPKLLFACVTGIFSGISFGLLLGSFALIIDDIHLFLNCMEQILIIFTGALFSIQKLPEMLQPISRIIPLTRSIQAARNLLSGNSENFTLNLLTDIVISFVILILGFGIYQFILRIAKKRATLSIY